VRIFCGGDVARGVGGGRERREGQRWVGRRRGSGGEKRRASSERMIIPLPPGALSLGGRASPRSSALRAISRRSGTRAARARRRAARPARARRARRSREVAAGYRGTIEGEGGRAGAHEVHADGGDVALRVGVVLRRGEGGNGRRRQRPRGGDASADVGAAARTERRRTAKRSKRHDLPTPESPISCGGGRGWWVGRGREDVRKMFRAARGRGDLRIARRRDVDDAARDAESRHGRGSRTHQELEEVIVFGVHRDGAVVERARVMVWRALGRRRTSSGARDMNG